MSPPWDPFTSLTLDLLTAEQQYLDDNSRSQVLVKVPETVHDLGSMVMNLSKQPTSHQQPTSQLLTPAQDSRLAGQINHPAHLVREEGNLSLSAFIPLCQLGDDMSVMGTQIPEFSRTVCSGFEKTVVEGELCYQADVNKYRDGLDWRESMQFSLGFLIDTNQEYDTKSFFADKRLRKANVE